MGGGLMADLAKYEELDDAQKQIEQLQVELRRFKTELADVEITADLQVTVDSFLKFADFFFDGLFADWAVLEPETGGRYSLPLQDQPMAALY